MLAVSYRFLRGFFCFVCTHAFRCTRGHSNGRRVRTGVTTCVWGVGCVIKLRGSFSVSRSCFSVFYRYGDFKRFHLLFASKANDSPLALFWLTIICMILEKEEHDDLAWTCTKGVCVLPIDAIYALHILPCWRSLKTGRLIMIIITLPSIVFLIHSFICCFDVFAYIPFALHFCTTTSIPTRIVPY